VHCYQLQSVIAFWLVADNRLIVRSLVCVCYQKTQMLPLSRVASIELPTDPWMVTAQEYTK